MISITINQTKYLVKEKLSILEACKVVGIQVPRFCYHESLSIAGSCRLCIVKLETDDDKLWLSCLTEVAPNMEIVSEDPVIQKAREEIIEFLLLDHPLDCPICDQGGECDLQDQAKKYGSVYNKFFFNKNSSEDKEFNVFIKTVMSRCIHCTRCVRYSSEIAGIETFGVLNRGNATEIGNYLDLHVFDSEISGNVIDLCPVGALTSKPYAFKHRPWELDSVESIDLTDGLGSNIFVNFYDTNVSRVMPKYNNELNDNIISDKARFSYDAFNSTKLLTSTKFIKNSSAKTVTNTEFLKTFSDTLKVGTHTILVSDTLNFEALTICKALSELNPNISISSFSTNGTTHESNFNITRNNNYNRVLKAKQTCFLIAVNPRTEVSVLNARLRLLQSQNLFNFYGLGVKYDSTFNTSFINFTSRTLTLLFSGKLKKMSNLLSRTVNALVLYNKKTLARHGFMDMQGLFNNINPSLICLNIQTACNSHGISLLNIKPATQKDLAFANSISFFGVSETTALQKFILRACKTAPKFFWINSFTTNFCYGLEGYQIPLAHVFQESGVFLNLEGRPQLTRKCFGSAVNTISIFSLINHVFFNGGFLLSHFKQNLFLKEMVHSPSIFSAFSSKVYTTLLPTIKGIALVRTYPFKPVFASAYMSDSITNHSSNMLTAVTQYFKRFHNFF